MKKKLLLLGDSIRLHYEPMIKEKLSGKADVYSSNDNGRFAQYTLCHLHELAREIGCANEINLVHWNNGLWDVRRSFGEDCMTPPETYAIMLKRIIKRINLLFPQAKIIFASSTPVIERLYDDPAIFRTNNDIMEYNAIAKRIMAENNIIVNDLYITAGNFPDDYYRDATHFTEDGCKILADTVVKICEPYLF